MSFTYPTPTTIDTFYTDANGSLVTPEKLPYGKGYFLVEVEAPYGYVLDTTPVYFDVTEDNSTTEESGVTVIKVNKANMAQKGKANTKPMLLTRESEVFSMNTEKRMIHSYEVVSSLKIGEKEVVLAMDEKNTDGEKYMTCFVERSILI